MNALPIPSLGKDTLICPGDIIVLTPGSGFIQYLWSDGSKSNELQVHQPGRYYVNVFDGFCAATDTIYVNICGTNLWFPNVFTPNNDGLNERFRPVSQGKVLSYQITIFNRWGQQIYESNDAIGGWDGTYNEKQCPTGTYFFIAEYIVESDLPTQKQKIKRGAVTLLR